MKPDSGRALKNFAKLLGVASFFVALLGAGDHWWSGWLVIAGVFGSWCSGSMEEFADRESCHEQA